MTLVLVQLAVANVISMSFLQWDQDLMNREWEYQKQKEMGNGFNLL